ncbi:MAG: 30S ribosomal protein S17 [Nanoarchaeota archaeon]|nr:30S ribosomal protein S17 [Nanoarchaeota archaeon]
MDVKPPTEVCKDKKCPFHGDLSIRGRVFTGVVVSDVAKNTVSVRWERQRKMPKYERYERRTTKIHAHNPECIKAKNNDIVKIAECRPLSKTKNFVVIEKMGVEEKVTGTEDKPEEKKKKETKEDKKQKEKTKGK